MSKIVGQDMVKLALLLAAGMEIDSRYSLCSNEIEPAL